MPTLKPELSEKNKHRIYSHRYYELKHFCLQYPYWKEQLKKIAAIDARTTEVCSSSNVSDPTSRKAIARAYYTEKIALVEKAAKMTDETLAEYILLAVTTGTSYDKIYAGLDIPCSRQEYYKAYRKFFSILSHLRN